MRDNNFKLCPGRLKLVIRKNFSVNDEALEQVSWSGGGVTVLEGFQEKSNCGTEEHS